MSGFCKYYKQKKQVSYDNGVTWTDVSPLETRKGELYESYSTDCGYVPLKFQAKYSDSSEYSLPCDGNTILSSNQTNPSGYQSSSMAEAVIGDCVTSIGDFAFASYMGLTSVTIPDSVTSIGVAAFQYCVSLSNMTIPNNVVSIGNFAFGGCYSITSATIPDSVTSIGDEAFYACYSLTSATIPSGVTSIGIGVFSSCENIANLNVNTNNTIYDSRNNCNAIIETTTNTLIQGCKNTVIPDSVTSIADKSFQDCTGLTSINIPSGVTSIGNYAFNGCSGLTSIDMPSGVTSIGNNAFAYCRGLTGMTVNSITPPSLGNHAFDSSTFIIYVPSSSVNAYKSASGWSTYASRIQAIP